MKVFNNLSTGKQGEHLAVEYLKKKKYQIIERNYKFGRGEIDIIAQDKDTLVFIEVKTRKTTAFGFPEESVTPRKQSQIRKIAQGFLSQKKLPLKSIRFDVIAVELRSLEDYALHHIKNAF
ncbi:MAG: YraN family protein [Candidatus Aminicenantes bacterium 4484_214]|nr:YraN family protein [Candidatus Aminicenantes bacterium]OQX52513.1 MAG: YraN family protein [Candidatus Aminicenantes bacterium 4484_214]